MKLLELTSDLPVLVETLKAAKQITRQDGRSKARDYVRSLDPIERRSHLLTPSGRLVEAVFYMDEDLLTEADSSGGMMGIPNSCGCHVAAESPLSCAFQRLLEPAFYASAFKRAGRMQR